jgi:hypothetical protein
MLKLTSDELATTEVKTRFNEKIFLGGTTNKSDWRDILKKN